MKFPKRGALRRKIQAQRRRDPEKEKIYKQAFDLELGRIQKEKSGAEIAKIQEKAKAAAARASMPKSSRFAAGLKTLGKKLEKIDNKKFEAYVTGVSTSGKKKK